MRIVFQVAAHELRMLWRGRVAVIALLLVALLSCVSAFIAAERAASARETRARLQSQVEREFDAQPDRHPHRMVHYGHFVFRPLDPLAAFDPGIDSFSGSVVYLEGHRQNSANFADVRQSSLLLRFGELTPAFVLQTLLPLLIVVLGAGMIATDRDRGTLRLMLAQGVPSASLLAGKFLALLTAGIVASLPAVAALLLLVRAAEFPVWLAMFSGYGIYLLAWTLAVLLVSTISRTSGGALRFLLGAWAVLVVLLPRLAPEAAAVHASAPSRFETEFAIQRELRAIGDSHDENDPYFAAFQRQTLRKYGVERVEDLPMNYKGLLAVEGERMTSELFDKHADLQFEIYHRQVRILDAFGLISPLPAIRRVSMAAARSDLFSHQRFIEQAERHRFLLVQHLNQLQADALTYADDTGRDDPQRERRTRIHSSHWGEVPDFRFEAEPARQTVARALPALGMLMAWVVVMAGALLAVWRFKGRAGR